MLLSQFAVYCINNSIINVPSGTVILSVPFAEIASTDVITYAIIIVINGHLPVPQNTILCVNAKYPPINNVAIMNIVSDPAIDFVEPNAVYFLLFIILPITAAKPSPYAITRQGINPNDGLLNIPNDIITSISSDKA